MHAAGREEAAGYEKKRGFLGCRDGRNLAGCTTVMRRTTGTQRPSPLLEELLQGLGGRIA
jgi:hypothetical protein